MANNDNPLKGYAADLRSAVRAFNHASHELAKRGVKVDISVEREDTTQSFCGERRCSIMEVTALMKL